MKTQTANPKSPRRRRVLAHVLTAAVLVVLISMAPGGVIGQDQKQVEFQKIDQGMGLYRAWCQSCHGESAKGDGPMAEYLRVAPSDLTLLSQKADGRFDFEKVAAKIDGREEVRGHGSKEMPVWGEAFKVAEEFGGEAMARAKIAAVVHYLRSIQVTDDS